MFGNFLQSLIEMWYIQGFNNGSYMQMAHVVALELHEHCRIKIKIKIYKKLKMQSVWSIRELNENGEVMVETTNLS